jgi:hypothetical protein
VIGSTCRLDGRERAYIQNFDEEISWKVATLKSKEMEE